MLPSRPTGQPREVDVVIRFAAGSHQALIKIEARASRRAADSAWVEAQLGKHDHLPAGTLVLVSEAGFTRPARDLALRAGALPLEPHDLEDPVWLSALLRRLPPLQPLWMSFAVLRFEAILPSAAGRPEFVEVPHTAVIWGEDAKAVRTVLEQAERLFDVRHQQIRRELADVGLLKPGRVPARFTFDFGDIEGLPSSHVFLQTDTSRKVVHHALAIYVDGVVRLDPFEINLEAKRLGDVEYISGLGTAAGGAYDTLVVTSADATKLTTTVQVTGDGQKHRATLSRDLPPDAR